MDLGVELIRALTDLYGEFMHTAHGMVRSMIDCTGARSLIREVMDAKASAPIKRAQRGAEEAVEQGIRASCRGLRILPTCAQRT